MQLTVHIGTTKTGSKSIQSFLSGNRAGLREVGLLVPQCLGEPINLKAVIASLPFGASPDLAKRIPIADAQSHELFRESTRSQYYDEIAKSGGCAETIITAELLHSRLLKREHIAKFKSLFCQGFEATRIVVYVRPQLDQVVSLYSTVLRNGYSVTMDEFLQSHLEPDMNPYFDLRDVVMRWGEQFGMENIIVRPYNGIKSLHGTLTDFGEIIGIDVSDGRWAIGPRMNSSINQAGQDLLLLLNKSGIDQNLRWKVTAWAEKELPGRGAWPSIHLARSFDEKFRPGNTWVVERYFPDNPEYLEPHWPSGRPE